MYDPNIVLASIDQNRWNILALCGFAMLCNYTYFVAAIRQGFRDRVYPVPIFCSLFWLVGDASMVLSYNLCFKVYNHWYLKLFWGALCITVVFELIFLYMILRFGREEMRPALSRLQFNSLIGGGLVVSATVWAFIKEGLGDPLFIKYFDLAVMAGPPFYAALLMRRGSTKGTNSLGTWAYTLMAASWYGATTLWFGAPFNSSTFIVFYVVSTASAAAVAITVGRRSTPALAGTGAYGINLDL